ncbi:MAG: nucleotidyltransferase [Elusimicrobia bacterium]|nr:nucleotidyltransferase [Elusimicrobiota bacterium]
MDFELVLRNLLKGFEDRKIRYAVMGGFALGALGAPRATMDLDFLVHKDDLQSLHDLMTRLGYYRRFHTENVSQYQNSKAGWGSVDFLHAFRSISINMLDRASEHPLLEGAFKVRILQPEDLIGLKVQAMANDSSRKSKEMADIEALIQVHASALDWKKIEEYYDLFNLGKELKETKKRLGYAK